MSFCLVFPRWTRVRRTEGTARPGQVVNLAKRQSVRTGGKDIKLDLLFNFLYTIPGSRCNSLRGGEVVGQGGEGGVVGLALLT